MNNRTLKKTICSFDDRRNIVVPGNAEETITYAVEQIISLANESILDRGFFSIALSGGSTPKAIYEKLSSPEYRNKVKWDKVMLFWSDERCVPPDHPQSNYLMAMKAGFTSLPIPQKNIIRMPAEADVEKEAEIYERIVSEKIPSHEFDLVMLGMGEDGHTASLFPKTHALHVEDRLVVANYITQKNEWRMTLTFDCINAARQKVIYVLGKNKAAMLKHVFTSPYQPDELPVQRIGTPARKALWIADNDASEELLGLSEAPS